MSLQIDRETEHRAGDAFSDAVTGRGSASELIVPLTFLDSAPGATGWSACAFSRRGTRAYRSV